MSQFKVNYLGCGSATPTMRHLPSCQVVDFRNNLLMVDCGEGAQLSMRRQRLKFGRLRHIFLSHLHGDHCLGLPGLISTLALTGKEGGELTVHTFAEGAELFKRILDFFCRERPFTVDFNIITPGETQVLLDTHSLTVTAFPLYHRVPCSGFIFAEKPKLRHLRPDMLAFHEVPVRAYADIKAGADFVRPDGRVLPNAMLTTDPEPAVSYAYASDTMMNHAVARSVEGVDTLYHEATYTEALRDMARQRGHSTAAQAAMIAREAGVKRLVLGHFSKRYENELGHFEEARAIFPNTILANEGLCLDID